MTQKHSVLPCFKCGKKIEIAAATNTLLHAMTFMSSGGTGSAVYDSVPDRRFSRQLRIHVCDDCVRRGAADGMILEASILKQPDKVTFRKWLTP